MRKLIVDQWMSLDGVVQAPGAADEHPPKADPPASPRSGVCA
jgi:hypothetical protein